MRLAVIVPVFEEAQALRRELPRLLALDGVDRIVVSDGGSRDASQSAVHDAVRDADAAARVAWLSGSPGRGPQLARGARRALVDGADVLVFLHADTRLPADAPLVIRRALADPAVVGGAFALTFDAASIAARPSLMWGARWINLRTRLTGRPLGDQAQFARADSYRAVGGFEDWPILEDLALINALRHRGRLALLPDAVVTSGRRFITRGPLRTAAINWTIWLLFALGASPHRLARWYRAVRESSGGRSQPPDA
ncbi:MAG: TIGR04283 family arsenosugar biosynthesis glycosyltransferase [Acidobacteriota bacterium]